jgi:flagellar hook-associated protein FlgK
LNTMNRQSKSHSSTTGEINKDITENLKRINELIKKII